MRPSPRQVALCGAAILALSAFSPQLAGLLLILLVSVVTRNRSASAVVAVGVATVILNSPASAISLAAPDANLTWLTNLGSSLTLAFQILAGAIITIAIAWAGIHFVRHRDQWLQSVEGLIAGVIGAAVVYHANQLVSLAAAGALILK